MKNPKILLIALALVLGIMIFLNKNSEKKGPTNKITISYQNKKLTLTYDILKKLPHSKVSGPKSKIYDCIKITDIASLLSKNTPLSITVSSKDKMSIKLNENDIKGAYISILKDKNGEYCRLIISGDKFKQRWLKYVTQLSIDK